jgi:outer membrane biosynthesis protein TonB
MSCVVVSAKEQCKYIVYPAIYPLPKKNKNKQKQKQTNKNQQKTKKQKQKQTTKLNKQTKHKYNKDTKQLSKCLTRAETSVVINLFDSARNGEKDSLKARLSPRFSALSNKFYIYRQQTNIVFILQSTMS